jgi:GDP-4-dehydro-6-deoxy-D-mannose reductase
VKYKAVNVGVLTNLCQALADKKLRPRIIAVSTAYVYDPRQALPITEQSKLIDDGSPYAESKLAMEEAIEDFRTKDLDIIIARPFNHIGPGQEPGFLVPDLFAKLKTAKKIIKVGNLANRRDYTDVRDVVRAYADLAKAESLDFNLYNIASGKSVPGQQIFKLLLDNMGLTNKVQAVVDQKLFRPNDFADLYGSHQRLHAETGWQPQIPLQKTLEDFVASQ